MPIYLSTATGEVHCRSFRELHGLVEQEVGTIKGAGELLTYDVALRLGAYLGIEPERVYLHAGTRAGAEALGLDGKREYLEPQEVPDSLQRLTPAEIEDCLCIYKAELQEVPVKP